MHPAVVTRTGNSRSAKTGKVRYVTAVQPTFVRYASGVQTVTTGTPPT